MNVAFGPVPSRRLGKSLGVNNLPSKFCTYSCLYCQIGVTVNKTVERRAFYDPKDVFECVKGRVEIVKDLDYVTFVPNGEPTLDVNLGREVEMLKSLGYPIAIITNSSLIWRRDVKEDLTNFDLVSLKIDAVSEDFWRFINKPHESLKLDSILNGILEFVDSFEGKIVTETMLIDVDYGDELEKIAEFLKELKPDKAYISIPTRPTAFKVKPASADVINKAYQLFSKHVKAELLVDFEGSDFGVSDLERDLLGIMRVHPIREDALKEILKRHNADFSVVEKLVKEGKVVEVEYLGKKFYLLNVPT